MLCLQAFGHFTCNSIKVIERWATATAVAGLTNLEAVSGPRHEAQFQVQIKGGWGKTPPNFFRPPDALGLWF
jgi:hypothetical protein